MSETKELISPFMKQCFVTCGASLNMAQGGLVLGFGAALLQQLQTPGSAIPIDDILGSWIASIPALFLFLGNFLVVPLMGKYGRRTASLVSITLVIIGWFGVIFTSNVTVLLVARSLQGVYIGMSSSIVSLLIGEYTSPRNRGGFLMTISVSISLGVFTVHTIGSYIFWRSGGVICAIISLINFIIVYFSPESPSWLASQGRYEECKTVFRWLRGGDEEDELAKMIDANMIVRESRAKLNASDSTIRTIKKSLIHFNKTMRRREFYRPVVIMIHIYTLSLWGGLNIFIVYAADYFYNLIGDAVDHSMLIITLDAQRVLSSLLALYIVRKVRRKPMLVVTVSINIAALLALAVYSYAKVNDALPFDHPLIAILLSHCMMFGIATGSLSLSFIIAGEVFPLEFKTLAGGICMLAYSANLFVIIKTVPYCFSNFGVHGTFCISAMILSFCLVVAWLLLPETKDRTLQDIEDEFRGRLPEELESVQPLTERTRKSSRSNASS